MIKINTLNLTFLDIQSMGHDLNADCILEFNTSQGTLSIRYERSTDSFFVNNVPLADADMSIWMGQQIHIIPDKNDCLYSISASCTPEEFNAYRKQILLRERNSAL